VIQYVYERYGRRHAAQVANVITYRPRSAIRDVGKALGYPLADVEGWAAGWTGANAARSPKRSATPRPPAPRRCPPRGRARRRGARPPPAPRDPLGGHGALRPAGGRGVPGRVGPDARAHRAPVGQGRLRAIGLVKFDLLGLGMLEALHRSVDLVAEHHGVTVDLALLPQESQVYDLFCRADTVGVFQVESRAQMGTLPRVRPRCFYDLVIEVALIRPGPSRARPSTPTSAAGAASSRSPTSTPSWSRYSAGRSGCRCSKSS